MKKPGMKYKAPHWLFSAADRQWRKAGLILVDTKYEFGRAPDGVLC
jgi:phosphoribosylaminoimidazole-succinocarboxamide synthase